MSPGPAAMTNSLAAMTGQFGLAWTAPADAGPVVDLIAFIGRDPLV